jgi:hypothetical protein
MGAKPTGAKLQCGTEAEALSVRGGEAGSVTECKFCSSVCGTPSRRSFLSGVSPVASNQFRGAGVATRLILNAATGALEPSWSKV